MRPRPGPDGFVHYRLTCSNLSALQADPRMYALKKIAARKFLATDNQIGYAFSLLARRKYSTDQTNQSFADFDLPFEAGISVDVWLAGLSVQQISELIDQVK